MGKAEKKENKKELRRVEPAHLMSPFEEFDRFMDDNPFEEMYRMFESGVPGRWGRWWHPFRWRRPTISHLASPFEGKTPRVDVIEKDESFLIRAELPGVAKEDIKITVAENLVTLEASTKKEQKEEKGDFFHREISEGAYRRTLLLPARVKDDGAKAAFKQGILELTIPKVEKTKKTTIPVE